MQFTSIWDFVTTKKQALHEPPQTTTFGNSGLNLTLRYKI